jgi:DNA-binding CsgD family transcriptional regulator
MTTPKKLLEQGRASFDRRAWAEAFETLSRAEGTQALALDDLERLAWSAALRGHDQAFFGALERLHQVSLEAGDRRRASRAAFWIGYHLGVGGASGAGWVARAARLVEKEPEPCPERGYVLLAASERHLAAGETVEAERQARESATIGETCADRNLVALAHHFEGRCLVQQGRLVEGLTLLDEVMIAVTSHELSPIVSGIVYCGAIISATEAYALDRAREWTALLARWCEEQPELVTFTGICLVHRVEVLQLGGDWEDALEEVRELCERRTHADPEIFGDACYQEAELLRLIGDFAAAELSYKRASENGCEPQPGLSLLRLAQGQKTAATSAIRRVLAATSDPRKRARFLPAFVDIMLAGGETEEAAQAASELEQLAAQFPSEILRAMAEHARGAVLLATGNAPAAIEPLRCAFLAWQKAGAPYIAARIRVLQSRALMAVGDAEGAELERAAAFKTFAELGARTDLALLEVATEATSAPGKPEHGLSKRELEVLRLLTSGKTNKAIARELFVSERTIDRHVSNLFTKIGVGSRAAATAYAYEHGLI